MTSFHSLKQKILNIHQNYLLAKKVYPKHIVRGGIYKAGKRRTSRIVDNSFELRTANIKKKRFKKKGQQVFSKKQFFEPKGLKSLSFTEFLFCYRKRTTFILKLKKALRKATSQRTNYFFILRSTNGGFSVYFCGIRGFVPRSQLQIFKNQIIKKYRLIKKKIPKKFGIKQKKLFNGKKIFVLSFPFKLLKFAVNLQRKKKWVNRKTKKEF